MSKQLYFTVGIVLAAIFLHMSFLDAEVNMKDYTEKYVSLNVSFLPWQIITRRVFTPKDIREYRECYIALTDQNKIAQIAGIVFSKREGYRNYDTPESARLVLDFIRKDGKIDTVFANSDYMYDETQKKYWKVDFKMLRKIGSIVNENVWTPLKIEGGKR